ncbi:hypothetical protein [Streptomyces daliensis]|uniref:Uncharacterized protein n=1 Tax=Streptomyces daliensis TaxID=299421 RepID=A0A8T4IZX6_9ACTN|nr:hypothetical protein [Streptomyces daliensis]
MENPKLELAAKRHREAEAVLKAAREDLRTEALEALRAGADPSEVGRVSGLSRADVRKLRKEAGS